MGHTSIFRYEFDVDESVVDGNGHVNNVVYVQWMQDIGIMHARALGAAAIAREMGASWFARSHKIEYLKAAYAEDRVIALTWIAECRGARARRRYKFFRESDGACLAQAETEWVFVDGESGRPKKIPPAILKIFTIVEDCDAPSGID